ncbi:MAG: adenylate/guanylate cyclase domain-containing protein [Planctomycetes bacterium]|nr:adenylate/guanylate cyclase domain-containing protein [Planctomycetota bacterium]
MVGDDSGIGRLLQPRASHLAASEFLGSSGQIPIAIALATVLALPVATWPQVVPLLAGAFVQSYAIAMRAQRRLPPSFLLNLIGAGLFTLGLACIDLSNLPHDPFLGVYWAVSLAVACCRRIGPVLPPAGAEFAIIAEHVLRSLGMVGIYAALSDDLNGFLAVAEHRFLAAAMALLGVALGIGAVLRVRDHARLAEVAGRLRGYSEMLLGKSVLSRAMGRDDDLRPRRTRRSVLFADVRGFTKWSEPRSPEEVLLMLDGVYTAAEHACAPFHPERTKHTGDEVMMFFSDPLDAARAAIALRDEVGAFLGLYGLHVGMGIHHGDVIEGLFGSVRTKAYDILGDTVNTAKRVSDHAKPGCIVVTFTFYEACRGRISIASDQGINAKGKSSEILVAELVGVSHDGSQTPDEG